MKEIASVVKAVKESSGYVMIGGGGAMTTSPMSAMAIIGALIGAGGLVVAVLRLIDGRKSAILNEKMEIIAAATAEEAKRANDLNEEKWRYQRAKNENDKKTEAKHDSKI